MQWTIPFQAPCQVLSGSWFHPGQHCEVGIIFLSCRRGIKDQELEQWAHAGKIRVSWTSTRCLLQSSSLLRWKLKPKQVGQKLQAVHMCDIYKTQPLLAGPLHAGPDQKLPVPRAATGAGQSLYPKSDKSLFSDLIYTPNHELRQCS